MVGDIVHVKGLPRAGNGAEGQCRPAIIVRQWVPGDNVQEKHVGTVQLRAFPDGSNDGHGPSDLPWLTSVQHRDKYSPEHRNLPTAVHYHHLSECDE